MSNERTERGGQHIGCEVTGCRYNRDGRRCDLNRIEIRPCRCEGSKSGRPDDESFCGSYAER
ncbi:MAG: DUF1540 domain-containing protein [Clostridia bacterium]|nr:DUF1540 domain-containing protein [Clostridia bacterium]